MSFVSTSDAFVFDVLLFAEAHCKHSAVMRAPPSLIIAEKLGDISVSQYFFE